MTDSLSRRGALLGLATSALMLPSLSPARATAIAPGTVLRVGDQTRTYLSLLEAAGLLKDVPYQLEFVQFQAAAPVMEALRAGAIDVGYGGDAATTFSLASGTPARIVASYRSDPGCIATIVPKGSPLQRVEDLQGRRIATVRGSVGHLLVLAALRRAGLQPGDVNFAFLAPADAYAAFASGGVDAWAIWTVFIARAMRDSEARILFNGRGLVNNTAYHTALTASIREKRGALEDYVRRAAQARLWALDNLDAYAKVWAPLVGLDQATARTAYDMERMRPVALTDQLAADQQALADFYLDLKVLPQAVTIAPFFDPSFNAALPGGIQPG